jgi:predicted nicotinamide N-methyase
MEETYTVCGKTICLEAKSGELVSTTGWRTWNAAVITMEFMKTKVMKGCTVWDVSSGNGLVALIAEILGARDVVATECEACMPLLHANFAKNGSGCRAIAHTWGNGLGLLQNMSADWIILSDLLFIAFRDSIEHLLLNSILLMARTRKTKVVLCYEERLLEREQAFIEELRQYFDMDEVDLGEEYMDALKESEAQGGDDDDEEEGGASSLFHEDPPMVLLVLTRKTLD